MVIIPLVILCAFALDVRGNNFAKVFTLSSGNVKLFLCWLARTITVAAYPIVLAYTHTRLCFENHHLRNGTSTICRTTHNFRVVKKSGMSETKWYVNHSMMGKVCNGCKRCCFLTYNKREPNDYFSVTRSLLLQKPNCLPPCWEAVEKKVPANLPDNAPVAHNLPVASKSLLKEINTLNVIHACQLNLRLDLCWARTKSRWDTKDEAIRLGQLLYRNHR